MVSSQADVKYRGGYERSEIYSNGLHVSPDLAPLEPVLEVRPGGARTRKVGPSNKRRSVAREILRLFVYGLIILTIGGAAFASQYGDDNVKETLGLLQRSVSELSPTLGASSSATVSERFSTSPNLVSTPDKIKEARSIQSAPASVTAGSSPQIQQQLETMAADVAVVRGLAEQIAVSQKRMAQDIAALETAKDNLSQKIWWLYESSTFAAPPHRSVKKTATSTARPSAAPVPAPRAQTP